MRVRICRTAGRFNASQIEGGTVRFEFTFDSRLQSDGTAGQVYTMFRNSPEWQNTAVFNTDVTFDGGPTPRLEMPDLFAREAMKELDRKITNARPEPRASYLALEKTRKFKFIELDQAYCESSVA